MMEKEFSTKAFIFVIVLSCSSTVFSLSIIPRVFRTSDATIIDFAEDQNDGEIDQVDNPGEFTPPWPAAAINPYSMIYQQQQGKQPTFYYGWSYFYRQPMNLTSSSSSSDAGPSTRQLDKHWRRKQSGRQTIRCGRGPATMPAAKRSLISVRIAAGADTKKNLWPFMVALKRGDNNLFCGGSLINSEKVLLAAQCLEQMSTFDISAVTVLIGMHKSDFSDVQMTRRISKIVFHSKYNAATFANDIAIITLDMPVPFSRTVSPVCLPPANDDPDEYADQDAIILGWGGTGITATGPVDVPSASGTQTVSGPITGTVGTTSGSGITAVSQPGTVNGPAVNGASGISISGPAGTGTTTGNVGGPGTGTRPISGPVNGPGTGTLTGPVSVGGSGANNRPSSTSGTGSNNRPSSTSGTGSTTTVSSGPVIETQTVSPVTSVPVTASTVGVPSTGTEPVGGPVGGSSSSYDGTVINIGGFSVISGKVDRPSRPSIKIRRAAVPPNPFLQQAKVAILSNAECRADSVFGQFVSDKTICISSPDKFTCPTDVGGPIVFLSSPGTWTLVGINSYTQDCKTNGLKTRVSAFKAWIDLYMN